MSCTIEEAKAFVDSAIKGSRGEWLSSAKLSWDEIKRKNQRFPQLEAGPFYDRRSRYPAWYSIFKIRQPLILSRVGTPIGKDTSQDGSDNVGATAALCLERLVTNLARDNDFFDSMCACRDDALATCFATSRVYYECKEVKDKVKEYITPQKDDETGEVTFIDTKGKIVESDDIGQDEQGFYLEYDDVVDVEEERVIVEHILYKNILVDPDVNRWRKCNRIAYETVYSEREFVHIFGALALTTIPTDNRDSLDESANKKVSIKVYEYWDLYEKETYWFVDGGTEFIKPKAYLIPEEESELFENGLYDLDGFFPSPKPLIINQPTDDFWPFTEFNQVSDITSDINGIFYRMVLLTRAINPKLLYDDGIQGLKEALSDDGTAVAFGVNNLAKSLIDSGGNISNVVQYVPVQDMIEGLNQLYMALEQRLQSLFKITGTSDLLQGLSSSNSDKTLGERQMEEKYAINQIAELQRKMQEFVRDNYQLMGEMALRNFKEESLNKYIMPQTLDEEHRANYTAAISLLKNKTQRFRIELETDSTIAINENYDKKMRIEFVNILTSSLESVAKIAATQPQLVVTELHALKYLIQSMRPAKMFQGEVTTAIDNVIQSMQNSPTPFNKDEELIKIEQQQMMMDGQLEIAKVNAENAKTQLASYKTQNDVMLAQQELMIKQRELAVDERIKTIEGQLSVLYYQLEMRKEMLDEQKANVEIQNKLADNQRLEQQTYLEAQRLMVEANKPVVPQSPQVVVVPPSAPQIQPIVIAPPAPAAGPTIINAPNPAPQTSIVQPVQEVPVPMTPPVGPVF